MKCNENCKLFGAYESLGGLENHAIIIHSVVGCHFGLLPGQLNSRMNRINTFCTVINDQDIIFNGENSLSYAIREAINQNPDGIIILTGCVSQIIQDDVAAVVAEFRGEIPIFWFSGAGFEGRFEEGYEMCLTDYLKTYPQKTVTAKSGINIFGLLADDFKLEQDLKEMIALLSPKVAVRAVTAKGNRKSFEEIPNGALNICFGRGEEACKWLKETYDTPYARLDYPYGIEGSKRFLETVEKHLKVDFTAEKAQIENRVVSQFESIFVYLKAFYQLPVGVYGTRAKAPGLARFLREELGMDVTLGLQSEISVADYLALAKENHIALLFGSSFEGGLAEDLGIALFPFEYPIFDRVFLGERPYVLGEGAIYLVEDLVNLLMILKSWENKGALIHEKNMHLR